MSSTPVKTFVASIHKTPNSTPLMLTTNSARDYREIDVDVLVTPPSTSLSLWNNPLKI